MPFLATSIIPLEKVTPVSTPKAAKINITFNEAAFEPIAEFKKFTASFATPTVKSTAANKSKIITMNK